MKTVQLSDEQYTALLSLGVIKEEQKFESIGLRNDGTIVAKPKEPAEDPHKGFIVGKKYKHKKGDIAYYCGITKDGILSFELTNGVGVSAIWCKPESWESKASNTYWAYSDIDKDFDLTPIEEGIQPFEGTKWVKITYARPSSWYTHRVGEIFEVEYFDECAVSPVKHRPWLINIEDCTEVEAPVKELKPWEKFPTLESCWERGESRWNIDQDGKIFDSYGAYNYSTEAEAKKARATIFLSRIARKWNEGVEKRKIVYFVTYQSDVNFWPSEGSVIHLLPFYFHSAKLAEKSLELFPEQWDDFYGR